MELETIEVDVEPELESKELESFKNQLNEIIKPYQQEQNRRQKKSDFLRKCIRCIEKNDFFELDDLLKTKQAHDLPEESDFKSCDPIFSELRQYAETQVDNFRVKFKETLLQMAQDAGLPLEFDFPKFSVLKGIEGKLDFATRSTVINEINLKSLDPKRIISTLITLKRKLYDSPFEPQQFIDSLFQCYNEIIKQTGFRAGDPVPVHQLYTDYVLSLQSKTFFQNMDTGKFKGYSIDRFAVDFWRFYQSAVSTTAEGFQIKLNPGRGKSFWLIDFKGEKRQITNVLFTKN